MATKVEVITILLALIVFETLYIHLFFVLTEQKITCQNNDYLYTVQNTHLNQ